MDLKGFNWLTGSKMSDVLNNFVVKKFKLSDPISSTKKKDKAHSNIHGTGSKDSEYVLASDLNS